MSNYILNHLSIPLPRLFQQQAVVLEQVEMTAIAADLALSDTDCEKIAGDILSQKKLYTESGRPTLREPASFAQEPMNAAAFSAILDQFKQAVPAETLRENAFAYLAEQEATLERTTQAVKAFTNATDALKSALDAAKTAPNDIAVQSNVAQTLKQVNSSATELLSPEVSPSEGELKSAVYILTYCMSMIGELQYEIGNERIRTDTILFETIMDDMIKALNLKTDEIDGSQKSAKHNNLVGGWIGKIVGAILVVIGVLTAVGTGGLGALLAGFGAAMFVVDTTLDAMGKPTLSSMILDPIMEKVISPIIEEVSKGLSQLLQSFGVPEDKADQIASTFVQIYAIVWVVALVAFVSMMAKKLPTSLMTSIEKQFTKVADVVAKAVPQAVKNLDTWLVDNFSLTTEFMRRLIQAQQLVVVIGTSVASGFKFSAAQSNEKSMNAQADVEEMEADRRSLMNSQENFATVVQDAYEYMRDAFDLVSTVIESDYNAKAKVLANLARG